MRVLDLYVTRQFLRHFTLVLFGFVALLQLFDMMKNGKEVVEEHGGNAVALAEYGALRFPEIVAFALPFAVLLGALLALAKLAHSNEIVALKSMGRSLIRVLVALMPLATLIAAGHFLLADQVVPRTQRALDLFHAESEERQAARAAGEDREIWLRDGHLLVRVKFVVDEGRRIFGVTLYQRSEDGRLLGRIKADRGVFEGGLWTLLEVEQLDFAKEEAQAATLAEWQWQTALTPKRFKELSLPPSRLSLRDNLAFLENPGYATHPEYLHRAWMHERISAPFVTFLMILLAGPIAGGSGRHGGIGAALVTGIATGFAFFITDGLMLAMAEAGTLPPVLAIWTPPIAFGLFGFGLLLRKGGW